MVYVSSGACLSNMFALHPFCYSEASDKSKNHGLRNARSHVGQPFIRAAKQDSVRYCTGNATGRYGVCMLNPTEMRPSAVNIQGGAFVAEKVLCQVYFQQSSLHCPVQ